MFNIYAKEDILRIFMDLHNIPRFDRTRKPLTSRYTYLRRKQGSDNYSIKNIIFNFYDLDVSKQLQDELIKT